MGKVLTGDNFFGFRNSLEVEDQWPLSVPRSGVTSVKPLVIIARMSTGIFFFPLVLLLLFFLFCGCLLSFLTLLIFNFCIQALLWARFKFPPSVTVFLQGTKLWGFCDSCGDVSPTEKFFSEQWYFQYLCMFLLLIFLVSSFVGLTF